MADLPKTFDPRSIEERWYAHWEREGLFRPERPEAEPWTIVMPPPNVTGSLHIGHALDITLQDVLTRRERMRGKDALWVVGTDHAGIATQMVVERNLESQGIKRQEIGREAFLQHVWEWKAQSGGAITRQLRRLGASCDWAHERFTMDERYQRAVTHTFVEMWKRRLVYRDKRLVNWDPKFQTAISDLEVETREVQGKFWTLRYPLADGSGAIEVATTRPETMLADMAVAVHPEDARYKAMVGKQIKHPITGRLIPIIADEHADPELGSGAVKITPGHDFNDFDVGRRAGIKPADMLNMFDAQAFVVQTQDGTIPQELLGLSREDARKAVVDRLEAEGAIIRVEDRVIPTPYGDRSGVVIEPWLTDQWYVDVKPLAERVVAATNAGEIRIVPETWKKTWFNWLDNIQPWCVSRQLWWGHRIPAWYGPGIRDDGSLIKGDVIKVTPSFDAVSRAPIDQRTFVAESEEEALEQAKIFYPEGTEIFFSEDPSYRGEDVANRAVLRRDQDVLDTWFSSALWPFATLGWPEESSSPLVGEDRGRGPAASAAEKTLPAADAAGPHHEQGADVHRTSAALSGGQGDLVHPSPRGGGASDLARHYPNDVLISGFDILFFWDARMAMQGIEFMGEAPWKTLYLHGLVRDAAGQKMSKSKGNTVDPVGLIDKYGADALRFTLAAMESQGRDIRLDEKRVEGYRNFATKLWNAARFLQMNGVGASDSIAAPAAELPVNRWIIGEVVETLSKLDAAFDELRYDAMADAVYHFVWGTFCDWYVELVKGAFNAETRRVAAWAFDQILVMLHPLMPFITEELWHAMEGRGDYPLITAEWPNPQAHVDPNAKAEMEWLIELVTKIRSARTELNVPPSARTDLAIIGPSNIRVSEDSKPPALELERIDSAGSQLRRLARIDRVWFPNTGTSLDESGKKLDRTQEPHENRERHFGPQIVVGDCTYIVPVSDIIDLEAEKARLSKGAEAAEKERDSLAARLANPNFTGRAKPEAVEKARADHDTKAAEAERLRAALERLG